MQNITQGLWSDVDPISLAKRHHNHPWHFGHIIELPNDRDDENWYSAFVFRREDHTIFGMREWIGGKFPSHQSVRQMATRVVLDKEFRDSLLSTDPDLQMIWKKR